VEDHVEVDHLVPSFEEVHLGHPSLEGRLDLLMVDHHLDRPYQGRGLQGLSMEDRYSGDRLYWVDHRDLLMVDRPLEDHLC
jgi:hypothetical protein